MVQSTPTSKRVNKRPRGVLHQSIICMGGMLAIFILQVQYAHANDSSTALAVALFAPAMLVMGTVLYTDWRRRESR